MENYGQLQAAKLGNAQPAPQMGVVNSLQELNNNARAVLNRLRIIAERIDGPRPEPVSENGVKETPSAHHLMRSLGSSFGDIFAMLDRIEGTL